MVTTSNPAQQAASSAGSSRVLALEVIVIAGLCALFFFVGLGAFGLVGPDEPRYAQVAREMFLRNDLVTPTLYGEVWLEKPALYYWRAMAAYRTFGVEDWVARLPSGTIAVAMIFVIFVHMRRFRPGAQLDAAVITASSVAIISFARGASTDMQLAAPFAIAMLGWYAWYETGKKIWLVDFYFFMGVAMLAKGPVAVLLSALIVTAFIASRRDWRALWRTLWLPGILLFLLVMLPWYIAVQVWNPQFFRVFILEHNLARFSSDVYSHTQPWWYYLPIFVLSLVPWTFFGFAGIWDAIRHIVRQSRLPRAAQEPQAEAFPEFLLIWMVLPVAFFSTSGAKLPGYILPAIPPATILIADYLHRRRREDTYAPTALSVAHGLLTGVLVTLVLLLPHLMMVPGKVPPRAALLLAGAIGLLFAVAVFATLRLAGLKLLRVATLLPMVLSMTFLLKVGMPIADVVYSARPVVRELERIGVRGDLAAFNVHRATEYGIAYYRNLPVKRYERGEIPAGDHMLLVRRATPEAEFTRLVPGRRLTRLGAYDPQKLALYWVSANPPGHAH